MNNKITTISQATWRGFMKVLEFWNKVLYFPWRVLLKLWHWVYDEI